jgi:hypothetical protein
MSSQGSPSPLVVGVSSNPLAPLDWSHRLPRAGRFRPPQAPAGPERSEGVDSADHGGIPASRRRPVVIAAETDLDALLKPLHLANARRVWRGLIDRGA